MNNWVIYFNLWFKLKRKLFFTAFTCKCLPWASNCSKHFIHIVGAKSCFSGKLCIDLEHILPRLSLIQQELLYSSVGCRWLTTRQNNFVCGHANSVLWDLQLTLPTLPHTKESFASISMFTSVFHIYKSADFVDSPLSWLQHLTSFLLVVGWLVSPQNSCLPGTWVCDLIWK